MNLPDDIQTLWQNDNLPEEDFEMWKQLIHEKRNGFNDLTRSENRTEYIAAAFMVPLLGFVAWKAKFPLVRGGYALVAVSWLALTVASGIAGRRTTRNDRSLREELHTLVRSYEERLRFLRNGKFCITALFTLGLFGVFMGIPGSIHKGNAWIVAGLLAGFLCGAQWISFRRAESSIRKKREEAARLLRDLPTA